MELKKGTKMIKILFLYIGNYFTKPIISFIVNLIYWLFHILKLKSVLENKNNIKDTVVNITDVQNQMKKFKWTKDTLFDWSPWVLTILNNDYKDDCDGAANLGKFLLNNIGIKSSVINLYGDGGHAVCISKDKKIMISNNEVVKLDPKNWKSDIFKSFNNRYNIIIY